MAQRSDFSFVPPQLAAMLGEQWRATLNPEPAPLEAVKSSLRTIIERDCSPPVRKGPPNTNLIRREIALALESQLAGAAALGEGSMPAGVLAQARTLAAADMGDPHGFRVCLNLMRTGNARAFALASSRLRENVVMHMSCVPRVPRAVASVNSFTDPTARGESHVVVTGSAESEWYGYDPEAGLLQVPASDVYEHLPSKVAAAFAFFALCGHINVVLKVDDDHRLADAGALATAYSAMGSSALGRRRLRSFVGGRSHWDDSLHEYAAYRRSWVRRIVALAGKETEAGAVQLGNLFTTRIAGNFNRVWHFGKCADPTISSTPFPFPADRFIIGGGGYFLNRAALLTLLWCQIYFIDRIRLGFYEDVTVSELLLRHRGRLLNTDMKKILGSVNQY